MTAACTAVAPKYAHSSFERGSQAGIVPLLQIYREQSAIPKNKYCQLNGDEGFQSTRFTSKQNRSWSFLKSVHAAIPYPVAGV